MLVRGQNNLRKAVSFWEKKVLFFYINLLSHGLICHVIIKLFVILFV